MVRLVINAELEDKKETILMLKKIIEKIESGQNGDYDDNVSWWLEE